MEKRQKGGQHEASCAEGPLDGGLPEADDCLLAQLRGGDVEAGHRFVREYYPGIYRFLLSLTGHREAAEDLTQETFLQAWRHLDQFQGRAPLRLWVHAIARREFLRARGRPRRGMPLVPGSDSERRMTSLEEVAALPEPGAGAWTDEAELRVLLGKLPEEQREVLLLHYLEGYSSREIAEIVQVPASTVRHRMGLARAHLARALGPGDLAYLNEPTVPMRQWAWLPLDQIYALEMRLTREGPGKRGSPGTEATKEESMERREFLRHAAVGAAGLMLTEAEKEVVDDRLTQKVTCTFKGTALSDLCEHLRRETGVQVTAGPSVADEKVTLFCEKLLLREVMRQLSRPFGYTWLRSRQAFRRSGVQAFGKDGIDLNARTPERLNAEYRYELVQDLRSQLLEEELRNRDRNTALLALQQEMERYRPYLDLSPDEALARSRQAGPEEKRLLRQLAGDGWGPVQMFFRLAPQAMEALRAGQKLIFSQEPKPGEQPLPAELARGVLQSLRDWQLIKQDNGFNVTKDPTDPRGLALTTVPEARARVSLELHQSELGQFVFEGVPGFFTPGVASGVTSWGGTAPAGPQAVGRSPAALIPDNAVANAKLAGDPALRRSITVQPQPDLTANPFTAREGESPGLASGPGDDDHRLPSPSRGGAGGGVGPEPKVTSADVLEALHQATGLPIVSDYFTRLHPLDAVSARNQPLFAALNQLADAMHRRWSKEGEWLQFRSTSFYTDRLKEVPNRLLDRWAAARRRQGFLTLEDLVEIAQLPDAPLDGAEMAEGARDCLGLAEWDLARDKRTRPHLRYLSSFTPAQRQEAMSAAGLPFSRMSLPQQQQFIAFALQYDDSPLQSLDELAGATLRVDYTQPGWFEWRPPGPAWLRWVVPGEPEKRVLRPFVRERTRAAALEALRRLDPHPREAAAQAAVQSDPRANEVASNEEAQIVPTRLELVIIYIPGSSNDRLIHAVAADFEYTIGP